jgi:hypothetical protein
MTPLEQAQFTDPLFLKKPETNRTENPIHHNFGKIIVQGQLSPEKYAGREPVHLTNFISRGNPLPDWYGDYYLNMLALHIVGKKEKVLTFKLPDGFKKYYVEVGIINNPDQIIEVVPQMPQKGALPNFAYPNGDLLKQLAQAKRRLDGTVLVSSLINEYVSSDAEGSGIKALEQPDSHTTNNKDLFRESGTPIDEQQNEEIRYNIFPGVIITDNASREEAMEMMLDKFKDAEHGVWLKLADGSGGDTVKYIEKLSPEAFEEARKYLRGEILKAYKMGELGILGEDAWPENSLSPLGSSLIIESDVRNHALLDPGTEPFPGAGGPIFLGSNFFITSADGSHESVGYYKQRTLEDGSFNGSQKHHPDEEIQQLIDEQTALVAQEAIKKGYFGPQGLDYFIITNPETKGPQVVLIERNGRPPISAYAEIAGRKLEINDWVNLNITFEKPIRSIKDFEKATGKLMFRNGEKKGVFPFAPRTIVGDSKILASPHMKVLILGTPQEQQEQIIELEKKGAILGIHGENFEKNLENVIEEKVIYSIQ